MLLNIVDGRGRGQVGSLSIQDLVAWNEPSRKTTESEMWTPRKTTESPGPWVALLVPNQAKPEESLHLGRHRPNPTTPTASNLGLKSCWLKKSVKKLSQKITLKKRSWTIPHWRPHSSAFWEYTSCLIISKSDFTKMPLLGVPFFSCPALLRCPLSPFRHLIKKTKILKYEKTNCVVMSG